MKHLFTLLTALLLMLGACRHDDVIFIPETVPTGTPVLSTVQGFYLLNQGNMGSNKCTLDYYDALTASYMRNIYAAANPSVPKELGDVGNDLKIYGSRLYAVVNTSNKVEVMNAADARRITHIDIPNCRRIAFHNGYAYVTSYAGPVEIRPDYSQLGFVEKIDTATLQVVDRCIVGYQPDGIAVCGDNIYVANSGGYRVPNYENTISVISLASFSVTATIPIAINLNDIVADTHGCLWISSRGDYYDTEAALYCYDTRKQRVTARIPGAVNAMWLHAGRLYTVGTAYDAKSQSHKPCYGLIDVNTQAPVDGGFITDGTESSIRVPYGVAVNPVSGEIYVTDARAYLNPGYLHCYSPEGVHLWQVRTGDVPACFTFLGN